MQDHDPANNDPEGPSEAVSKWLEEHMNIVKKKILDRATEFAAQDDGQRRIEPRHIAKAAEEYAPGDKFPEEVRWRRVILSSISGVTVISALLAIVFAGIAMYKTDATGYFDIAKLFAGAVVGSTGAAVASAAKKG